MEVCEYKAQLTEQLPEMLKLLAQLVNIDSGSYVVKGVNAVGSILSDRLAQQGFAIRRVVVAERGDLVVAERSDGGHGRLVILGHLDTVWPDGTVQDWAFRMLGDGMASGPGVGDMKGGLVMALYALQVLRDASAKPLESIKVVLVPDEELGSVGSRALIEYEVQGADVVLVLEPGRAGGGIVTARGALGAYFLQATGCTAHCASNYHLGASAVRELARKVVPLEALSQPEQGMVVNVGVFQGGAARQVVPGEAHMAIDLRARTQAQADALQFEIQKIAQERHDARVRVQLGGQLTRPAFTNELNGELMHAAQTLADALSVTVFECPPVGGGSDGNFTAAMGIPTLDGLGPVCHDICSRQEAIEVQSLVDRGALFCGLIERIPSLFVSLEG